MSGHKFYKRSDFTAEEIARDNKLAMAVINDKRRICMSCGYEYVENEPIYHSCSEMWAARRTQREQGRKDRLADEIERLIIDGEAAHDTAEKLLK